MEALIAVLVLAVLAVPVLLVVVMVGQSRMGDRVRDLEATVAALKAREAASPAAARVDPAAATLRASPTAPPQATATTADAAVPAAPVVDALTASPSMAAQAPGSAASSTAAGASPAPGPAESATQASPLRPTIAPIPPPRPRSDVAERAMRLVKRWFTTGNVPVKVGMLVLLAGVAALLKYASDQGWLTLPPELRLAGVAAAAMAGLAFGWRERDRRPVFARALQGGAIGVLLLVVFAACKVFGLVGQVPAFALSVALVAGLCVLAVAQHARALAILGILAGFLAPLWLSSGGGNHVALFSYYAMLNAGIVAIAWFRPWRELFLLGFVFTWGIGTAWGVLDYGDADRTSAQAFLALFFVAYLLLPLFDARRRPPGARDKVQGALLFGTPLVAFSLQAALMHEERLSLAFVALGVAAAYAGLAWALAGRPRFALLAQAHAVLAVGFATLAVPLALSAGATAAVFALEGAGMVWLGLRTGRRLPLWTGLLLQPAAAIAYGFALSGDWEATMPVANTACIGALMLAVGGFACAWTLRDARRDQLATALYGWGLWWLLVAVARDIDTFVLSAQRPAAWVFACAAIAAAAALVHRARPAAALAWTVLGAFLAALFFGWLDARAGRNPLAGLGALAWIAFAVAGGVALTALRAAGGGAAVAAQFAWWLLWPVLLSLALWRAAVALPALATGWQVAAAALPWMALLAVATWRRGWLSRPLGDAFAPMHLPLSTVVAAVLTAGWAVALGQPAGAAPLPWLPLANPLELVQLAALLLLARWTWSPLVAEGIARIRVPLLAVAGFAFATAATLRGVHHLADVPWAPAMAGSATAQTALTVTWSVLGVVAWVAGSRRGQRALWLAGAVLMGVVLAKLVIVDRQHLGNLAGIGSFLAYGLLCTVVGWLAPAPPRREGDGDDDAGADAPGAARDRERAPPHALPTEPSA